MTHDQPVPLPVGEGQTPPALKPRLGCIYAPEDAIEMEVYERAKVDAYVAALLREREQIVAVFDDLAYVNPAEKSLVQRVTDELADFKMVMDHCSQVYDHFSRGRISKPNTIPSCVISEAEGFLQEDIAEAVKEETEELSEEVVRLRAALEQLQSKLNALGFTDDRAWFVLVEVLLAHGLERRYANNLARVVDAAYAAVLQAGAAPDPSE